MKRGITDVVVSEQRKKPKNDPMMMIAEAGKR